VGTEERKTVGQAAGVAIASAGGLLLAEALTGEVTVTAGGMCDGADGVAGRCDGCGEVGDDTASLAEAPDVAGRGGGGGVAAAGGARTGMVMWMVVAGVTAGGGVPGGAAGGMRGAATWAAVASRDGRRGRESMAEAGRGDGEEGKEGSCEIVYVSGWKSS